MMILLKAQVAGYTRQDGVVVRPYANRRQAGSATARADRTPLPAHLHKQLFLVRHPGLGSMHRVSAVHSAEAASAHDRTRAADEGNAVLVRARDHEHAADLGFAWDQRASNPSGAAHVVDDWHQGEGDHASFHYIRERA